MKRILILLILLLLLIPINSWGATYYMRADGTAANKAAAVGPCTTVANCMSVHIYDEQGIDAFTNDTIVMCDDGGIYRDTLRAWSAGLTLKAETDEVTVSGADLVTTFVKNIDVSEADTALYDYPTTIEPMQVWEDDERLTFVDFDNTGCIPLLTAGTWGYSGTTGAVYVIASDSGSPNTQHTTEVGQRSDGIHMASADGLRSKQSNYNIIVDGMTVEKVAAIGDQRFAGTHNDGSDYIAFSITSQQGYNLIVKNTIVKQMGGGKYYKQGTLSNWSSGIEFKDSDNCIAEDCIIYDGHCVGFDPESLSATATVGYIGRRLTIYDIDGRGMSAVGGDGNYQDITITNCGNIHPNFEFTNGIKLYDIDQLNTRLDRIKVISSGTYSVYIMHIHNVNLALTNFIIVNPGGSGLVISSAVNDVDVFNGIIYDDDGISSWPQAAIYVGTDTVTDIKLKNTIIYTKNNYALFRNNLSELDATYNLYYRADDSTVYKDNGATYTMAQLKAMSNSNLVLADPLFRNAADGDFRLGLRSPAKNKGTYAGIDFDRAGQRINKARPCIGAYEIPWFIYE